MKPTVAILGRPNVGKSTLFNRLTRTREALVADQPGITRDYHVGEGRIGNRPYLVIDTGGVTKSRDPLASTVSDLALKMAQEADAILWVVDGRDGRTAEDDRIAEWLRHSVNLADKPVFLVVNKTEALEPASACAEFYGYGMGEPMAISSAHGEGMEELMARVFAKLPPVDEPDTAAERMPKGVRVAVLGRPNVGKSTLVNRMLGEERMLTYDQPGTTRDAVAVPFVRDGKDYVLIDTAGVRRRARMAEDIEKFSVIKALQAIDAAHVVILVIDAQEGVTEQDASLLGQILDSGRALVIAVNKWDGLSEDQKTWTRNSIDRRLDFANFARVHYISALHGSGVGNLFESIDRAHASAFKEVSAGDLTDMLGHLLEAHQPPLVRGRRIKLRYAHLGGHNPPRIVIHGNQTESVPNAYRRYLENEFRKLLKIEGTPLKLEFRTGE
ncbi:MAG TPA: ribosome biogenesis GTPase Der, partial [Gammaproteobacteria bacterium]|nr:ribosome biogenesis GTPase Der [Gammaproteobacteria bacterium]